MLVSEYAAASAIGERIIDMADRLRTTDKVVPGTVASTAFKLDGIELALLYFAYPRARL